MGIPLPCDVQLSGSNGPIPIHTDQLAAEVTFVAEPGIYSLVVSYPGFQEVRRRVSLEPLDDKSRATKSFEVLVELEEQ